MARLTRKIRKMTSSQAMKALGRKELMCWKCKRDYLIVSSDVSRVMCERCVQRLCAPPDIPIRKVKSDKPRGWALKKHFEHNGVVYAKGVAVTDKAAIKALRAGVKAEKKAVKVKKVKKVTKRSTPTAKKKVKRGLKHARSSK